MKPTHHRLIRVSIVLAALALSSRAAAMSEAPQGPVPGATPGRAGLVVLAAMSVDGPTRVTSGGASLPADCGVVLTHVGGLWVDIHDDGDMWLSFDAIEGTVDLTIDGPNGIELAPGAYSAVWDDGTSEPFTLACIPDDDPPLEVAGEDPTTPPPAAAARTTGEASYYDDGPGLYGAVHSFRFGDPPYFVKVCRADAAAVCVRVVVRDHMANQVRAIDLSPDAFVALAPLSQGVVQVTVETYSDGPSPTLPATDTEDSR